MEILLVICLWFSIGFGEAQLITTVRATSLSSVDQTTKFSNMLRCDTGYNVYLAGISYWCPSQQSAVSVPPSTVSDVSSLCWMSSTCTVVFSVRNCSNAQGTLYYACAPVRPSLTINSETTDTGSLLTAGYLTSPATASGDSAWWVCTVEARGCSNVNVTFHSVIRNGNSTASQFSLDLPSYHSVPVRSFIRGVMGVDALTQNIPSPFNVILNVVPGSALLNAYFAVQANISLTVTCGRRPSPQPTFSNNVSIASTPPSSLSGQELTAVHSSSGGEIAGDWQCVVETADCSTGTPVQLAFYLSNRPCRSPSYFLLNGNQVASGSSVTVTTPLAVTLHLVQGSVVNLAYFSVAGEQNLTVTCGRPAGSPSPPVLSQCAACQSRPCEGLASCVPSPGSFQCLCPAGFHSSSNGRACLDTNECTATPPPCDVTAYCNNMEGSFHCYCDPGYSLSHNNKGCNDINECTAAPPPCDVTAHCNNTEGSFHCYCDPGYTLSDNGRGCQDPSITEPRPQTSVVGPAAGGAAGGVVVIAVVIVVIVVVVSRSRNRKTLSESETSLESDYAVYINNAYEDPSQNGDSRTMVIYETPVAHAGNHQSTHPKDQLLTHPGGELLTHPEDQLLTHPKGELLTHPGGQPLTHPDDQLYTNAETPASAVTPDDVVDYDVLGQTRPSADAKSDAIYSHVQRNHSQPDDVEYSYDRAGENPRRRVITGNNYETPTFLSLEDEGGGDGVEYGYNSTSQTSRPAVITDAVYHALQPVSSTDEPVQDSGNEPESQATPAFEQPGSVAVDLDDGPIYTNSEVDEGGSDQAK